MLKLPPPFWTLVLLVASYLLSDVAPLNQLAPFGWEPGGLILALAGVALSAMGVGQFRAAGTQVLPLSERNDKLVTTGLYAYTRNPMYLGMVVFALGAAMWFSRPLMYVAPLLIFAILNYGFIPFEETKMARQHGEAFAAYRRRVRRWL